MRDMNCKFCVVNALNKFYCKALSVEKCDWKGNDKPCPFKQEKNSKNNKENGYGRN